MLPDDQLPRSARGTVARNLRAVMARNDWNAHRLALFLKMQPKSVTRLLDGAQDFGIDLIESLAAKLRCKPWDLLRPDLEVPALQQEDSAAERDAIYVQSLAKMAEALEMLARGRDPDGGVVKRGMPRKPNVSNIPPREVPRTGGKDEAENNSSKNARKRGRA